jgi:hypothetical protein
MFNRCSESDRTRFVAGTAVLACAMICAVPSAKAQDSHPSATQDTQIVGIWLGTLEAEGERIRVVFNISKDSAGALEGTMDSPDRGRRDLRITAID